MKIPYPFQELAIGHMSRNNTLLADDCGLGKTLQSIEAVRSMEVEYKKNLVVCPKSSRTQWRDMILEQIPDAEVILTSHLTYKFKEIDAWFIVAYDEMNPKSILYPVARIVWNSIILDEAHRIRNHQTQRSKNIINLWGARKIALTATPIEKHGGELWPILKWLDPSHFPGYWKWVNKFFEVSPGFFGGYEIGDPKDQVAYQAEVIPYVVRRTKEQVLPDLPPKIFTTVRLDMDDDQSKVYNEILDAKDALVQIHDQELLITNALTLFTRLHQVASAPSMLGFDVSSIKQYWLGEFLQDHKDLMVVVFSKYVETIHQVASEFGASMVTGGRDESDEFKKGNTRLLAGTIDAMSESLNLGMADAAVFLDQHWSATKMTQAIDRIHRMDITSPKLIYFLEAEDVDRRVIETFQNKWDEREMLLSFVQGK